MYDTVHSSLITRYTHRSKIPVRDYLLIRAPLLRKSSSAHGGGDDGIVEYPTPPSIIYGHVHMAKTAGTEINGMLSMRYERICGTKGYSYDAISTNQRAERSGTSDSKYTSNDSFNQLRKGFNRGRVPTTIMNEIGYDDCDYISQEAHWTDWITPSKKELWRDFTLELLVPCRDPIDHLLSNCNHRHHEFQCRPENDTSALDLDLLKLQIQKCHGTILSRFSMQLDTNHPNIHVKCYDFHKQFNEYMEYMDRRLQKRRIAGEYFHRDTNLPRNKTAECLWGDDQARHAVSELLLDYDYYILCDRCLDSENDLLAS